MPLITYGRTFTRVCTKTHKVEKTHLLAAQRSSFKDQIHATFGAEAYERAIFDKWGESWLAMQNDKELSFRIYSAGAAQKPNHLELGNGELLPNLLLGILLGPCQSVWEFPDVDAIPDGEIGESVLGTGGGGSIRPLEDGHGAHFVSNCFLT